MLEIVPVPCLLDNLAYLVVDAGTRRAAVVDPSDADRVTEAAAARGVSIEEVWATHHHADHVGGIEALAAAHRTRTGEALAVRGHASESARIPLLSHGLEHGGTFHFGDAQITALHVPAHTRGALAFHMDTGDLFTGDTMFAAGCGRLFEGTASDMAAALLGVVDALPADTRLWFGHDYAARNVAFACSVEPGNSALAARAAALASSPAVPGRLDVERATSPFLRVARSDEIRAWAAARGADPHDAVSVLAAVRAARDVW